MSIFWEQRCDATASGDRTSEQAGLPLDMWWLPEACQIAVEKARRFIKLFGVAASHSHIIRVSNFSFIVRTKLRVLMQLQGLVFSASYVESACCLLFYDSRRDHRTLDTNIACMNEAIDCLSNMVRTGPVPGVISTLQQMLVELEQVKRTESSPLSLSRNAPVTPRQPQETDVQNNLCTELPLSTDGPLPTQRQTSLLSFNAKYGADIFDLDWSHTLPFKGMEYDQDSFALDIGGYFNPVL
jgi:hypothetical protein